MSKQGGKSKAMRIRLDYHKQRGSLYWFRWICAAFGFLSASAYGLYILAGVFSGTAKDSQRKTAWGASASMQVSTGTISKVHSHFQSECQLCHLDEAFLPIASDAFKPNPPASHNGLQEKCNSCHQVESHVARIDNVACQAIDQNCCNCHGEHVGFDANLVSISSSKCTQCHNNLNEVCNVANLDIIAEVGSFVSGHSKFRSLDTDPGRIKFSHAQHMQPGQIKQGRRGGFQVSMLPEKWKRDNVAPDALVQLSCSDCHKLRTPSGEVAFQELAHSGAATDAEFSLVFEPIRFDEHCAACHQFTFAGQSTEMLPLPHAATRQEFQAALSARLVGGRLTGRIAMRKDQALAAEIQHSGASVGENASATLFDLVEAEVTAAVDRVASGCTKCHQDENLMDTSQTDRRLSTPMIPRRWLKRGLFDHGSHPMSLWQELTPQSPVEDFCIKCHDISSDESSSASQFVMIKGPESCTPCHRRSEVLAASENHLASSHNHQRQQVASDDCVLCHRYHWSRPRELP